MGRRYEEKIRDYIADNLSFIDETLTLIKKEYKLDNIHGTKGFVDILAKDNYNNYVVIEVKRSNQAARQAIHEIMKYVALLKHNYKLKESEVRIIIISTDWNELLIPFSELLLQNSYHIEGYKIDIDANYLPVSKSKVAPVKSPTTRKFSRTHFGYFCEDNQTIDSLKYIIEKVMSDIKINDFILIELQTDREKYPNKHALYFVIVSSSKEKYWNILEELDNLKDEANLISKVKEYIESSEEDMFDDSELYYLEQSVFTEIVEQIYENELPKKYFLEIGNPESFTSFIENWEILKVNRYGFLKEDIRLGDDQIKNEIMGLNGTNRDLFIDICESKFLQKFNEVKQELNYSLSFNSSWKDDINQILDHRSDENTRISIFIYSPSNILFSLHQVIESKQWIFLPHFEIIVDYIEKNHPYTIIYTGQIHWNGKKPCFKEILEKYFYSDVFNLLLSMTMHSIESMDEKIMQDLGLEYVTKKYLIEDNEIIRDNINAVYKNIEHFFQDNREFLQELNVFFNRYSLQI
ncbi:DUF91 domain-containing protein [Xylanibacillus composti]|uniref:Endonuclease NucS C-terminal domain-containing protein n=1 Tax=Xylanibacillus composti TaxID=1572762 RepID=A0A8J4H8Z5_9BACL|nr:endonuclease NucS domain-containing protein [Xylanibacillus composti]MDT9723897.1 DUF91 domain-containing protein [Xylanibacillus composti]GIQ71318.1 hypothetical protein XYCOK13_41420 [Xylanibacillus composti]